MEGDANKTHSPMRIPVPWVFVIAYMVGIGVQFAVPVSIGSAVWLALTQVLGVVMLAVGAILAVWAQWIFRKVHTTTVPYETTTKLVDWGPYRFTRNPMYLGLFLFFGGISVAFTFVWSILLLVVVVYYVNTVVIPVEEKQLRRNFADAYEKYSRRVRRWI
jgi:protein-S-isoprenylcysteine O-methyltransferase Ste14